MKKIIKLIFIFVFIGCGNPNTKNETIDNADLINKFIEQGDSCMRSVSAEEAIKYYNKALALNPRYIPSYFRRAYAEDRNCFTTDAGFENYCKAAIDDYTTILTICPKEYHDESGVHYQKDAFYEAYGSRASAKERLEDHSGAIKDYSSAIELNKDNYYNYLSRADSKFDIEDYRGAILDYSKAIELNPENLSHNNSRAYNNRGAAKRILGDIDGACIDWSKAGELGASYAYESIKKYCK